MKALVTGANGLLGSHLVRALLKEGHEVRAMVRKASNCASLEGLDIEYAYGDVREKESLRAAAEGCDIFFHTAAVFSYWGHSREDMMSTAREGAHNAVSAAKDAGIQRIVLTSSTAVLGGKKTPEPLAEYDDVDLEKQPDYFASKTIQERASLEEGEKQGVEVVAVNPSVFLGPYDFGPSAGLPTITGYLRDPLKMTWGGGACIAHVEDIADAHVFLATHGTPGERHIVSAENWTWRKIHETIADLAGVSRPRLTMTPRSAVLGATVMEMMAKLTGKPPQGTRDEAQLVGRYFWYNNDKVSKLGFTTRPSRQVFADTIAWLLDSHHLTEKEKARLSPSREVQEARMRIAKLRS